MGTRIKDFEATGIAPNGRLYAGDLNQIQDDYADLSNFSQTVDIGTLRIGETGLQLLRYGVAEARLSGAFRTDGITRALGGLYAGAFTTAQRDAIPVGFRPYGLIILNTTTNRLEFNAGSDATPNWLGLGAGAGQSEIQSGFGLMPAGAFLPFGGSSAPTGFLMCDGTSYPVATYPALHAAISYAWGGSGANFNVPNMKGMVPVMRDAAQVEFAGAVGTGGGNKEEPLDINKVPSHNHTVNSHAHVVNSHAHTVNSHSHGGVTGPQNANHSHGLAAALSNSPGTLWINFTGTGGQQLYRIDNTGNENNTHGHSVSAESPGTDAQAPGTSSVAPGTDSKGNGAAPVHPNLQPFKLVNYIIKT